MRHNSRISCGLETTTVSTVSAEAATVSANASASARVSPPTSQYSQPPAGIPLRFPGRFPPAFSWPRLLRRASSRSPPMPSMVATPGRSEEHTSELQSRGHLVCRLLLEKKKHNEQGVG